MALLIEEVATGPALPYSTWNLIHCLALSILAGKCKTIDKRTTWCTLPPCHWWQPIRERAKTDYGTGRAKATKCVCACEWCALCFGHRPRGSYAQAHARTTTSRILHTRARNTNVTVRYKKYVEYISSVHIKCSTDEEGSSCIVTS